MKLHRESSLEDIFLYLTKVEEPTSIILYVDKSPLCNQYTLNNSKWMENEEVRIVEVSQDIVETLQIGKVPQFRFYINGTEVHELIGTVSQADFLERKNNLFSSVLKIKNYKSSPKKLNLMEL